MPGATIIADVKASQMLYDRIAELGGEPLMWKTGHSLIKTKMRETGAPLAGEMSGHIFFAHDYYGFDDAQYAAVRLIRAVHMIGKSLTQIRGEMPNLINTRSEEHTSELQSLMRTSSAVFCLKNK